MRHIFILTLNFLFFLPVAKAQLKSISESNTPCEKVFFIDGNKALGTSYVGHKFRDLILFDTENGQIISVDTGYVISSIEHNSNWYFLLKHRGNKLTSYASGTLTTLVEWDQTQSSEKVQIEKLSQPDLTYSASENGFYYLENGQIIQEVDLGAPVLKLSHFSNNLLAITKNAYFILSPSNFSIIDSSSFPMEMISYKGAHLESKILLSNDIEFGADYRKMALYDLNTDSMTPIINTENNSDSVLSGPDFIGEFNNKLVLSGTSRLQSKIDFGIYNIVNTFLIDTETGLLQIISEGKKTDRGIVNPIMIKTKNIPVLFGRLSIEGVEPYVIVENKLEVLKDIYPGNGSGLNFSPFWNINPLLPQDFQSFHFVEQNGIVYFTGRTQGLGHQLWRSDGSKDGTYAISNLFPENKGFKYAFLSAYENKILVNITENDFDPYSSSYNGDNLSKLYELNLNSLPIPDTFITQVNWEVSYTSNPEFQSGMQYIDNVQPQIFPAKDGSTAFLIGRMGLWRDYFSHNQLWVNPANRIQGFLANYAVQIIEADGTLRSSTIIRNSELERSFIGRNFDNGHSFLLTSVGSKDVFVNEMQLPKASDGHFLFELDNQGNHLGNAFFKTGGISAIEFSQIEINPDGIYAFGIATKQIDFGNIGVIEASEMYKTAVLLKFNFDLSLDWVSALPDRFQLFGDGMNRIHLSNDKLFLSFAGTAINVRSTCANSNWKAYIARMNPIDGEIIWQQEINSDDVFRISSILPTKNDFLWVSGYSRGNLSADHQSLSIQECSYNGFIMGLNQSNGVVQSINRIDRGQMKFPQDMRLKNDYVHVLSLIKEENQYYLPNHGDRMRWSLQMDRYSINGEFLDSAKWGCSLSEWSLNDILRDHKFTFKFHPDEGYLLAAEKMISGQIEPFLVPPPDGKGLNSWLLERRLIPNFKEASPQIMHEDSEFVIFPNPTKNHSFQIRINKSYIGKYNEIAVFDTQGRLCAIHSLELFFDRYYVSLDSKLPNGLYFIHLIGEGEKKYSKLVLNQ